MLSKLFLLLSVALMPGLLAAQQDPKITENKAHPNLDYKQMGAPMPPLAFMAYIDTSAANNAEQESGRKKNKKKKAVARDTTNFALYKYVTDKDLESRGNLIIMMFNPTCSHCEDVAFMMEKHISLFKKTKVVLLANKMMTPYIPDFAERHHIARYPAMQIGYDSSGFIDNVYLYQALPQLNIYDSDRKLLKTFTGELPIDTLKKFIQ
jgi:hypothetical protein